MHSSSSVWDGVTTRLGLTSHEHVAIVGGGGKTSLMFAIAEQLSGRRLITTTTKMGGDQDFGRPVLFSPSDADITSAATRYGQVVVWGRAVGDTNRASGYSKVIGVTPRECDRWFGLVDHVVVEADGARRKPFKTPKQGEPVVPATATIMVIVAGADALGRVVLDSCHRPLRVAALAGCKPGDRLTPQRAARVLTHRRGFLQHVPAGARVALVITKVTESTVVAAGELIEAIPNCDGPNVHPRRGEMNTITVADLGST